jgi:hypothetical protein
MAKVYLLLRNNKQTGPFSLEEIIALGLKPHDLIWVEGKSFGWSYPSEVEALKPYAPSEVERAEAKLQSKKPEPEKWIEASQAPGPALARKSGSLFQPKKIFVSLPGSAAATSTAHEASPADLIEQKAEELRRRAQAYRPEQKAMVVDDLATKYAKPLTSVEEDYTSWLFQKKSSKRKKNLKPLLGMAAALVITATAVYLVQQFNKSTVVSTTAAPANGNSAPVQMIVQEELLPMNTDQSPEASIPAATTTSIQHEQQQTPLKKAATVVKKTTRQEAPSTSTAPTSDDAHLPPQNSTPEVINNEPAPDVTANKAPEKKKTFGEKVGGFFEKLKQKKANDEASPAPERSTPGSGGERKSQRRDETAGVGQVVDLSESVSLTSNQNSGQWMMGVKGAKITLKNNSSHAVTTAVVEVVYYNEQNEVLDRKSLSFRNVPAKKSATLPAPDHRLADHIDYRVVSASGITE